MMDAEQGDRASEKESARIAAFPVTALSSSW